MRIRWDGSERHRGNHQGSSPSAAILSIRSADGSAQTLAAQSRRASPIAGDLAVSCQHLGANRWRNRRVHSVWPVTYLERHSRPDRVYSACSSWQQVQCWLWQRSNKLPTTGLGSGFDFFTAAAFGIFVGVIPSLKKCAAGGSGAGGSNLGRWRGGFKTGAASPQRHELCQLGAVVIMLGHQWRQESASSAAVILVYPDRRLFSSGLAGQTDSQRQLSTQLGFGPSYAGYRRLSRINADEAIH